MHGRRFGDDGEAISPLSTFIDDEGGYTTVAMALSLLLSITLVLFAGRVQWSLSRAAEVQEIADASAMAGANVVARYATVAQVCDALVLTMGLAGLVTCGAALILAVIPGAGEAASGMLDLGTSVLDARSSFARSAVEGLRKLEGIVPALVVLDSIAVVEANEAEGLSYAGVAVPVPFEGMSDFSSLDASVDTGDLERKARDMQNTSDRLEEARKRMDDALMRGWMADCGNRPRCMRERAATLAGLAGSQNPDYPSPEVWTFGAALVRARTYYPVRRAVDVPEDGGIEALVDSCARKAFYDYAIEQLSGAYYVEHPDGRVDLLLPEFPHNTAEMRATSIYTEQRWPCTDQGARVLHATRACPGATGPAAGSASLAELDAGTVSRCPVCEMDATDMGKVAAASTSIDNGFEHYWREIVWASRDYERARNDYIGVEDELEDTAREGVDLFERALEQLSVERWAREHASHERLEEVAEVERARADFAVHVVRQDFGIGVIFDWGEEQVVFRERPHELLSEVLTENVQRNVVLAGEVVVERVAVDVKLLDELCHLHGAQRTSFHVRDESPDDRVFCGALCHAFIVLDTF